MNEYRGGGKALYHFDMYRIFGEEDLHSTGYFDIIDTPGITAIEWSENILEHLPEKYIKVTILPGDCENSRRIIISNGQ
jgi:tRNA threonylcarbamoyladenosine biosynthesis protein TsaE